MSETIQAMIDKTARGGTLKLEPPRCEFEGPAIFRRPITVVGQGCSLWTEMGPVIIVESSGVVLQDLNVEVTGSQSDSSEATACALVVRPKLGITLQGVVVRGNVMGLDSEEGAWRYPRTLRLGVLRAGQKHTFTLRLAVPVSCRIGSDIAGLEVSPQQLAPGPVEVTLSTESLKAGTRLRGFLKLRTSLLTRQIQVTCNLQADAQAGSGTGQCIDQPKDWAALTSAPAPPARPAPDRAALASPPVQPVAAPPSVPVAQLADPATGGDDIPDVIPLEGLPQEPGPASVPAGSPSVPARRRRLRPPTPVAGVFEQTSPLGETTPKKSDAERDRPSSVPISAVWGQSAAPPAEAPTTSPAVEEPAAATTPQEVTQPEPVQESPPLAQPASPRTRRPPASPLFLQPEAPAPQPEQTPPEAAEQATEPPAEARPRKRLRDNRGLPGIFTDQPPKS